MLREPLAANAPSSRVATCAAVNRSALPRSRQKLSKVDFPLWPNDGIVKRDLVAYYDRIAPVLVPHLDNRLIMLERHPFGVGRKWFLQKDALPEETPSWVRTQAIWAPARDEGSRYISYHVGCSDTGRDQLFHFADLCALTLHASAATADSPDFPDMLFIDLDPFGVPFAAVQRVSLMVKSTLDELGLRSYVKTSGATGLHIYVPLIKKTFTHEQTRLFAAAIAKAVADKYPEAATIERLIRDRTGKVYIDYGQNGRGRTLASVYSPRALSGAPVSTPLRWDEVECDLDPRGFTMDAVLRRVRKFGDQFESVLWDSQDIAPFLGALKRRAILRESV